MTARAVAAVLEVVFDTVPAARYRCFRCGTTEGPVTGAGPVKAFVDTVKAVHAGRCTQTTT